MWEERGRAFQNTLVDQLVAYTDVHFRFEQDLMSEHGYPSLAERVEQNASLVLFLRNWLLAHIMKHDQKFARTLKATTQP